MTEDEIKTIVKATLDELTKRRLIQSNHYKSVLEVVNKRLCGFFNGTDKNCIGVGKILRELNNDDYIDIIYLQYRDLKTLEFIAEYLGVDISTVKRNKKRLINKIYELLEDKDG